MDIVRLISLALHKCVSHIQVFGDSSLSINWNEGISLDANVLSKSLVDHIKVVTNIFEKI